jgi:hypothetical protein
MLTRLGRLFNDLQPNLQRCAERLFDLEKAFRQWFYHPKFRGRSSIKVTLPALSNLTYDGLEIADGDTAAARFVRMARGHIRGDAAERVRLDLLAYCGQDTLAMVELHAWLARFCR